MFDKLLLMADGYIIYQGSAAQAPHFFRENGHYIPKYANPADYFLKKFYVPFNPDSIARNNIDKVVNLYNDILKPKIKKEIEASDFDKSAYDFNAKYKGAGFCKQLLHITKRTIVNLIRNPLFARARVG